MVKLIWKKGHSNYLTLNKKWRIRVYTASNKPYSLYNSYSWVGNFQKLTSAKRVAQLIENS